jgi:hypothetical protein
MMAMLSAAALDVMTNIGSCSQFPVWTRTHITIST